MQRSLLRWATEAYFAEPLNGPGYVHDIAPHIQLTATELINDRRFANQAH